MPADNGSAPVVGPAASVRGEMSLPWCAASRGRQPDAPGGEESHAERHGYGGGRQSASARCAPT